MIGAIAGNIIGSRFEGSRARECDFTLFHQSCRFTDDTVCTLAVANALLGDLEFARHLRALGRIYPNAGYGGMFRRLIHSDDAPPYGSWGNGAPMRVAAVGWLATTIEYVDRLAEAQAAQPQSPGRNRRFKGSGSRNLPALSRRIDGVPQVQTGAGL